MRRSLVGILLCLLAGLPGCVGFSLDEVDPEPIAFLYRSPEEARRRAAQLDPGDDEDRPPPDSRTLQLSPIVDMLRAEPPEELVIHTFGRVVLIDPRTGDFERLGTAPPLSRPVEWMSTPEGRNFIYATTLQGKSQLMEYDPRRKEVLPLTRPPEAHTYGSVRADGALVYTQAELRGTAVLSRLFLRENGRPTLRLTAGPHDYDPTWSPDGKQIVYASIAADGSRAILSIRPDGGDRTPVVIAHGGQEPAFTPDGEWIVYTALTRDGWRLRRMRPDGTGKTAMGPSGKYDEFQPTVSPSGRFVVYVSFRHGFEKLRIRRFDGTGDRPFFSDGDGAYPVW